ncbi:hypothetical protein [Corynebacterium propinquum]|uniref:hypothetical protein n=1 Tax=Corynebacterium propinquum TaxID=43769 RepID=UPI002543321A|nr:hypothetical protein [Corynebacterium propinquum]MDK4282908.1 hypothetical protein [Corynebacterium propinquum]
MTETHAHEALRRWAAGKHITKARLQDLIDKGYVTAASDGPAQITEEGTQLLNGKATH